jgi:hypothetical protein
MKTFDLRRMRLNNQRLAQAMPGKPSDVVSWLGAIQAQDYAAAKWAVGQRTQGSTDAAVEQALDSGAILRTHVMRPTWHFVAPADIRWLLALTAPHVNAANGPYYRKHELDQSIFKRSNAALEKALRGGKQLTRNELASALQHAGIAMDGLRLTLLMMHAELDAVICSGPRRGKQFTYALLDERVPSAKTRERDQALAELTERYYASRGPATIQDYAWWSGLPVADARLGLEMVKSKLEHDTVNDQTYWFLSQAPRANDLALTAYLLPNYDEYIVGYNDRSAIFDSTRAKLLGARGSVLFAHTMLVNGQVIGAWTRVLRKDSVTIKARPINPLTKSQERAVMAAVVQYGAFLGLPVALA